MLLNVISLALVFALPQPAELGLVPWERNLEVALQRSQVTRRPVLILFDEVPGCSTVLGFGTSVLSNPTIVARLKRDFELVVVYNNVTGADAAVLKSFGEPSWNNPVVRVVDAKRRALAGRFDGPYNTASFERYLDSVTKPPAQ
jgi:hypothetical protein